MIMIVRLLVAALALAVTACNQPSKEETASAAIPDVNATSPAPAPAAPPVSDDAPTRTHSGKVPVSQDASKPPALGPSPSKVLVVVYSDFQCPVCKRITDATYQIAEEWPGEVRVEFRQLALSSHRNAQPAAVAALAAQRQGKFWEMHDLLFANQSALDATSLEGYAQQLGLDMDRYRKDIADPALAARVADEGALAAKLGASATPAFLINGKLGVGWASWMAFRYQVEQERKAVDGLLNSGTSLGDVQKVRAREHITDPDVREAYLATVGGGKS